MPPRPRTTRTPRKMSSRKPRGGAPFPMLNAQYRNLMKSADSENRDPYDNTDTFTARGSKKIASKARKFVKAALLVGGVAALAYFYKGQIGASTKRLFASLGTTLGNTIKAAKNNANKNPNNPGFGGRTVQGVRSIGKGLKRIDASTLKIGERRRKAESNAKYQEIEDDVQKNKATRYLLRRSNIYPPHAAFPNEYKKQYNALAPTNWLRHSNARYSVKNAISVARKRSAVKREIAMVRNIDARLGAHK